MDIKYTEQNLKEFKDFVLSLNKEEINLLTWGYVHNVDMFDILQFTRDKEEIETLGRVYKNRIVEQERTDMYKIFLKLCAEYSYERCLKLIKIINKNKDYSLNFLLKPYTSLDREEINIMILNNMNVNEVLKNGSGNIKKDKERTYLKIANDIDLLIEKDKDEQKRRILKIERGEL